MEALTQNLNLKLIIPHSLEAVDEDSVFLVTNLYTKTKLGEDALINVSIEKTKEKKLIGSALIRSKVKVNYIN